MTTTTEAKPGNGTVLTKPTQRQSLVVHDDSAVSHLMDTARFEHVFRIAQTMGASSLTPKHLKGRDEKETAANCFRVVNQALRWKFDPFVVADETYVVHGRLGYQGKLVAAVVNSRAGLRGKLRFRFDGAGADRKITVAGRFLDEDEDREVDLTVKQAKTDNEMWTKDPDQKLVYSGVIKWARRHCPEVIMGILTDDDLDRIRIDTTATPVATDPVGSKSDALASRLAAQRVDAAEPQAQEQQAAEPSQPADDDLSGVSDALSECQTDEQCDGVLATFNVGLSPTGAQLLASLVEERKAALRKPGAAKK